MSRRTLGYSWITALALLVAFAPTAVRASSHSEAPGTAKDRLADDTDLYAWVAKDAPDKVTIVGNWVPLLEPNGGPNFYSFDDEAFYYINIDNVGDAQDHIRYEFKFHTTRLNGNTFLYNTGVVSSLDDPDLNVRQTYTITRYENGSETVIASDLPVAPNFVGPASMPNYDQLAKAAVRDLPGGGKVFVGPRDDPFFVDLAAIFDLVTIRKFHDRGRAVGNQRKTSGNPEDGVGGYNVLSIVLQVPMTRLTKDGQAPNASNSVIGIYDSAERNKTRTINGDGTVSVSGDEIQVSRLGNPLVNEVVIPLKDKDKFNATKPTGDIVFLPYVVNPELAGLFTALYGIPTPPAPRNDLVAVFLTGIPGLNKPANDAQAPCEMLRLNMAVPPARNPSRFGLLGGDIAGFPNGRRLGDDVVDIAERVVAGATPFTPDFNKAPNNTLGDNVDFNDKPYLPYFPYVAPPHNPADHKHHEIDQHSGGWLGKGYSQGAAEGSDEDVAAPALPADGQALEFGMSLAGKNPGTTSRLTFTVPTISHVKLNVYDIQGREVRKLLDQDAAPGTFNATWDGLNGDGARMGKGVYFVRLVAGGQTTEKKVVLE